MSKFNIYCKFDISYSIYQFENKDIIVLEGDYHPLLMSDFFDMKVLHYECSKLHLFSLFVLNATDWNFEKKKKMWKVGTLEKSFASRWQLLSPDLFFKFPVPIVITLIRF